jgi:hypothetical protein
MTSWKSIISNCRTECLLSIQKWVIFILFTLFDVSIPVNAQSELEANLKNTGLDLREQKVLFQLLTAEKDQSYKLLQAPEGDYWLGMAKKDQKKNEWGTEVRKKLVQKDGQDLDKKTSAFFISEHAKQLMGVNPCDKPWELSLRGERLDVCFEKNAPSASLKKILTAWDNLEEGS